MKDESDLKKTIQRLLRSALGLEAAPANDPETELAHLFGTWSDEEADAFREYVNSTRTLDETDWR